MISNFVAYMRNGFGFTNSFRFAVGRYFSEVVADLLWWAALLAAAVVALWFLVNGLFDEAEARVQANRGYQSELEKVVGKCLSPGDKPIVIGNELWMIGGTNTGVKL